MKVYYSEISDPLLNLSIEKWLLGREDLQNREVLFFYRNAPSVIIGRFQNPWLECDLQAMSRNNISMVRRESGGGAVYHDMGNMNFAFICDKDNLIQEERTGIIVDALNSLRIQAQKGKRNDIYIDGKKISGSAGRYTSKRALHHGTLLIDTDLRNLNRYLLKKNYTSPSVNSQGIASIPSKVTNISQYDSRLDFEKISRTIIEKASEYLQADPEIARFQMSDLEENETVRQYRSDLGRWDWQFGRTPTFTIHRMIETSGRNRKCRISVKRGIIEDLVFDDASPESVEDLKKEYKGKQFDIQMSIS